MPRDKASTTDGVKFTLDSAKQIADVVRTVQGGDRKQPGVLTPHNAYPSSHYLSFLDTSWDQDAFKRLNIFVGDPGYEEAQPSMVWALNKFGKVEAGEWVLLARANGFFYRVGGGGGGGGGFCLHGTYSGSWANGGATNVVTVRVGTKNFTFTVKNWLTPISGTGGDCIIAQDQDGWTLLNFDLTKLDNYKGGTQVLGSEGSALKWFDTVICT